MMHADQVLIGRNIARGIIIDQFPEYRHERIKQLETIGTVNAIYRIGSDAAARFPLRKMKPLECADMLHREATAMTEFAENCPVPTPRPLGLGRPDARYPMPWSVQSWIEGDVATPTGFATSTAFARDLAHLIASLRAADTHGRRFDGNKGGAATFPITMPGWKSVQQ